MGFGPVEVTLKRTMVIALWERKLNWSELRREWGGARKLRYLVRKLFEGVLL